VSILQILPIHIIFLLCPVYVNKKENWRILNKKEIYASLNVGLDMYREWKKIEFPKAYSI
jgi:hypothetical protein